MSNSAITKEAEVTMALLNYVGRCIEENDLTALRELKLPYDVATRLDSLTLNEFRRYVSRNARAVPGRVTFDADVISRSLDHLKSEIGKEGVLKQLVIADAPRDMLEQLEYVLTKEEYRQSRADLGVVGGMGRTPEPDAEVALLVFQTLTAILQGRPITEASADDYLLAHQRSGMSLRVIWKVVATWNGVEAR